MYYDLTRQQARASGLLDLLLGELGEVFRLHDNGDGDLAVPEELEVSLRDQVDHGGLAGLGGLGSLVHALPGDVEELVDVDGGGELPVLQLVELPHTDLTEVTRVILVEVDSVVVLPSGVTATSRMLAVLPDAAVSHLDVAALFARVGEAGRHVGMKINSEAYTSCQSLRRRRWQDRG
jgi:hypothetical protein